MFEIKIIDAHLKNKDEKIKILESIAQAFCLEISIKRTNSLEIQPFFDAHPSCKEWVSDNLDASGAQWDSNLHSANKSKTVDGLWRARRNSNAEPDIEEEPTPKQSAIFKEFLDTITVHRASGKLPTAALRKILEDYGLEQPTELQTRQDLIPAVLTHINEHLKQQGSK